MTSPTELSTKAGAVKGTDQYKERSSVISIISSQNIDYSMMLSIIPSERNLRERLEKGIKR